MKMNLKAGVWSVLAVFCLGALLWYASRASATSKEHDSNEQEGVIITGGQHGQPDVSPPDFKNVLETREYVSELLHKLRMHEPVVIPPNILITEGDVPLTNAESQSTDRSWSRPDLANESISVADKFTSDDPPAADCITNFSCSITYQHLPPGSHFTITVASPPGCTPSIITNGSTITYSGICLVGSSTNNSCTNATLAASFDINSSIATTGTNTIVGSYSYNCADGTGVTNVQIGVPQATTNAMWWFILTSCDGNSCSVAQCQTNQTSSGNAGPPP